MATALADLLRQKILSALVRSSWSKKKANVTAGFILRQSNKIIKKVFTNSINHVIIMLWH
jgi:hypothetical protein